jgi:hypothetical protein
MWSAGAEFGRRQNSGCRIPAQAEFWWPYSGDGRFPATTGFRRPDVVGLRRRLDLDDRQLLNYDDRISNMRVRMKSLISENDLRF